MRWFSSPPKPPQPTPSTEPPSGSLAQAIAQRSRANEDKITGPIAAGFVQRIHHSISDDILTQDEETNVRIFLDRMASLDLPSVITGSATPDRASADRITNEARHANLTQLQG